MSPKDKQWIDNASYEGLLHKRRFAPIGDSMFSDDETYQYFKDAMLERSAGVDKVQASKNVGWENNQST